MRAEMTQAENMLWQSLRKKQVRFKFRRQHAIGPFIVDFYCVKARLIGEVDGLIHAGQADADLARQDYLESRGLRVMPFTNEEVMENTNRVLDAIEQAVASSASPLSSQGEGVGGEVTHHAR